MNSIYSTYILQRTLPSELACKALRNFDVRTFTLFSIGILDADSCLNNFRSAGAGIWTRVESLEGFRARPDYTTPAFWQSGDQCATYLFFPAPARTHLKVLTRKRQTPTLTWGIKQNRPTGNYQSTIPHDSGDSGQSKPCFQS